jgi:hypothetical protein
MGCGKPKQSGKAINQNKVSKNESNKGLASADNKAVFISEAVGDIHAHYEFGKVLGKGTRYFIRLVWSGSIRHPQRNKNAKSYQTHQKIAY